ncbi:MAG: HAD family hydrolase [Candidatus Saccharimonadales bacterium]
MIRESTGTIRLFSFDFWDTLVASNPSFALARNALVYEQLGCEAHDIAVDTFTAYFNTAKQKTERQSEREGRHIGLAERLGVLCVSLNLPAPSDKIVAAIENEQHALSATFPAHLYSEGVPALLQSIADSGRAIGVISNTGMLNSQDVMKLIEINSLDNLITHHVFSDQTGFTKPNSRAFYTLTEFAGVAPETVLHTGDNKFADYEGARANGMYAVHASLDKVGIAQVEEYL